MHRRCPSTSSGGWNGFSTVSPVGFFPPLWRCRGLPANQIRSEACPGIWFHPASRRQAPSGSDHVAPSSTIVYLHGGGYIGTSPRMYSLFMAHLARVTGCAVFAADYRLAPEFPFPAAVDDIISVIGYLMREGLPSEQLFIAGDSGGGGLLGTVLYRMKRDELGRPAGALLFSPEVSLTLSEDSVTANAALDVLPWNIPVDAYLHGVEPDDERVDVLFDDLAGWPPTFVVYGADEMFRDAIRTLVRKLQAAEVPHVGLEVEGMFHVFPSFSPGRRKAGTCTARPAI